MKQEQIKQVYETPVIGVHETKVKAVICQSNASTSIADMWETNIDINF